MSWKNRIKLSKSKMLQTRIGRCFSIANDKVGGGGESCDKMLGLWWKKRMRRTWERGTEAWMLDGWVTSMFSLKASHIVSLSDTCVVHCPSDALSPGS